VLSGLAWLLAVVLAVVPHLWVQLGAKGIIGLDGYYHIRYAELLRQAGRIAIPFPWLPTTILNPQDFTDHHLLFHLLLIPFTLGDLIVGAKVAAVLFATAATLVWFAVARLQGVRQPLVWLLVLIASSEAFLYRLSMTRRQSLVLLLLLLAVHLVLTRRTRWLLPLGFAFFWLYDGWPLLLAVGGLACLGRWLEDRRVDLRLFGAPLLGVLLGMVVNPFFPNSVIFPIRHLLPKLALSSSYTTVRVGTEWYAYPLDVLIQTSAIAVLLPLLGLTLTAYTFWSRRAVRDAVLVAWGGCALLFLALFLNSRRFVEYEPAFATMFAAVAWSAALGTARAQAWLERFSVWLRPAWLPAAALVVPLMVSSIAAARHDTSGTEAPQYYAGAAGWLAQNTLPGERVFATDWDDFPRLFYFDTRNVYLVGLDPTYMYLYDPELYLRWRSISRGEVPLPAQEIRTRFNCRWVFTDTQHAAFLRQARADPRMQQVYADHDAIVFFVTPS